MSKRKPLPSLRISLMVVFASCWMIPIVVFTYFIFHNYQNAYIERTDNLMRNAVDVSGVLATTKINDAISTVQRPTYEGKWENLYFQYKKEEITRSDYLTEIKASLTSQFYMDEQFSCYAFYVVGEDKPSCYASRSGYGYADYNELVQPVVDTVMEKDSDYIEIHVVDNTLYLIRNLYSVNEYQKFGTLVVGMERGELLSEMPLENRDKIRIYIDNGSEYMGTEASAEAKENEESIPAQETTYSHLLQQRSNRYGERLFTAKNVEYAGYAYYVVTDNYRFILCYSVAEDILYSGLSELNMIVTLILISMIPMIILTYIYLTKQIENPLRRLTEVSQKIKAGRFGSVVEGKAMPNMEFDSLVSSVNSMSVQVKHLFETVYLEKMATKDAQIAALQAQINPHFLNNTLEMMNWQARMNNDIETSKMIEALGTVLDFSMNRTNDRLVRLSDELRCGDAFLYIMSMRFGQRLKVEKDIDKGLLQIYVPQLILQPLLENAIKHGIEQITSGTIWVKIYREENLMVIDVINTGKILTEKQLKRIEDIIDGSYRLDTSEPGTHTSIGIYNVNKRIQLIYGNEYGLTVFQTKEDRIVSRIIIPTDEQPNTEQK